MAEKITNPSAGQPDTPPPAPADLGRAGATLWAAVVAELDLDAHERRILADAGRTADTIATLERSVPAVGLVTTGARGGLVLHPAVGELRLQRQALARLLSALRVPPPGEDDPAGRGVPTRSQQARRAALSRWHGPNHGDLLDGA